MSKLFTVAYSQIEKLEKLQKLSEIDNSIKVNISNEIRSWCEFIKSARELNIQEQMITENQKLMSKKISR